MWLTQYGRYCKDNTNSWYTLDIMESLFKKYLKMKQGFWTHIKASSVVLDNSKYFTKLDINSAIHLNITFYLKFLSSLTNSSCPDIFCKLHFKVI